jgi:hypothetical protein
MDQRKVEKTRELIDCGFYDDPEILDALLERCVGAIIRDENRSPAKGTHAPAISQPPTERANHAGVRLLRRRTCAATVG